MKERGSESSMRNIVVSSCGEVFQGGNLIPGLCSIDTRQFKTLSKEEKKAAINAEFDRRARAFLAENEYDLVKRIWEMQDTIESSSRFRIYGRLENGEQQIWIVTEFIALVEDTAAWDKIDTVLQSTAAATDVLHEAPGEEYHFCIYEQDGPKSEHFGLNSGKLERQVELSWRIETLSLDEVRDLRDRLARETQEIWTQYGVDVI